MSSGALSDSGPPRRRIAPTSAAGCVTMAPWLPGLPLDRFHPVSSHHSRYFNGRVTRYSITNCWRFPSSTIVCDVLRILPGAHHRSARSRCDRSATARRGGLLADLAVAGALVSLCGSGPAARGVPAVATRVPARWRSARCRPPIGLYRRRSLFDTGSVVFGEAVQQARLFRLAGAEDP
jgi:hypothetical protein